MRNFPDPGSWARMQEMGRTPYIVTRTLRIVAILAGFQLLPLLKGNTYSVGDWLGDAFTLLLATPVAYLLVQYYWNQAEDSAALHRPTEHTPRFEGDLPVGRK